MLFTGATMVTRNKAFAWFCVVLAVSAFCNQRPMRTKEGGGALNSMLFAFSALLITYMNAFILPAVPPTQTQAPLP